MCFLSDHAVLIQVIPNYHHRIKVQYNLVQTKLLGEISLNKYLVETLTPDYVNCHF